MSEATLVQAKPNILFRFDRMAPTLLLASAVTIYVVACLATGQTQYLSCHNLLAVLGRSIALGITAIGQTFVILVASVA
ncbi:MAG: hypothetical protein KF874_03905 [Rhizobiaceae bacterium]|nr:hypothetical protein [Rhizobiaceae bacterium]